MNKLLYALFISIFFFDYLSLQVGVLTRYATWTPELLSMVTTVAVVFLAAVGKRNAIPAKYMILVTIFVVHVFIGLVLNAVPAGAVIAGLRNYLKFLPFFFLPMVYDFSDVQIKKQLKFIIALIAFQAPVTLYQRLVQYKGLLTGDPMTGTVGGNSGLLAVVCTSAIAVLMGFYLKDKIKLSMFLILVVLLFIPTTIGEAKAAIIFLPVAFFAPVILAAGQQLKVSRFVLIIVVGVVAMIGFLVIYDYFITPRWGYGLLDFFAMEGRAEKYLYRGVEVGDFGADKIGRIDSWVLAIQYLSANLFQLIFGLGIGNATGSFIGGLSGDYAEVGAQYAIRSSSLTVFLWEIGILGAILYFVFFWNIFRDARRLSRYDGLSGVVGLGWAAVVILISISVLYKIVFGPNVTGYLFWYLSGYVVASLYRRRKEDLAQQRLKSK